MDPDALRQCILSTFDNTPEVRLNAEQQLKQVYFDGPFPNEVYMALYISNDVVSAASSQAEQAPGFIGALLDIVDSDPHDNIRLSGEFTPKQLCPCIMLHL